MPDQLEQASTRTRADLVTQKTRLIDQIQTIEAQLTSRRAAMQALRSECLAEGSSGYARYVEADAAYQAWRGRAASARRHLATELTRVKEQLALSHEVGYGERFHRLRGAVRHHRDVTLASGVEPEPADLALWAVLDEVWE